MTGSPSISFIRQHIKKDGRHYLLDEAIADEIMKLKLSFGEKVYYSFCERYVDDDAEEALYLDEENNYFREITTDYDTFKYFHFLRGFYKKPVFCDIGCGIGNVLYFAQKMGYQPFGFEINRSLASIHKKIKADVVYADISNAPMDRLSSADVIYLYRPVNDDSIMDHLFQKIHKLTKRDIIVLYNYPHKRTIKGFETITLNRYDDHIIMLLKR